MPVTRVPRTRELVITPVTGTIGARVTGLDLRAEQGPVMRATLDRALHEHGVLFVEQAGPIDDDDHARFAGIFGTVTGYYLNRQPGSVVTVIDSEGRGNPANGTDRWHTDGAALECPPQAASLRALVLPETGGDTVWAIMYAAYDALSSHYQRLLEGLEALHTSESVYRRRPAAREALGNDQRQAVHPVVIRDPVTTRSALYVNSNWTERILGLTDRANESLLRMLFEHVNTPDFHVRFAWDTHTVVVWEERVTQHRAINDYAGRRILHRVTVEGPPPAA